MEGQSPASRLAPGLATCGPLPTHPMALDGHRATPCGNQICPWDLRDLLTVDLTFPRTCGWQCWGPPGRHDLRAGTRPEASCKQGRAHRATPSCHVQRPTGAEAPGLPTCSTHSPMGPQPLGRGFRLWGSGPVKKTRGGRGCGVGGREETQALPRQC